jgi:hypothetical protein
MIRGRRYVDHPILTWDEAELDLYLCFRSMASTNCFGINGALE